MIEYLDKYHHGETGKQYRCGSCASLEQKTAQELQKKGINLTFLPVLSGKWRREKGFVVFWKNIVDLCKFLFGVFQSVGYLLRYSVDVIFCKGGYAALPAVIAGFLLRKKIFVHESDTRAGLVNTIASYFATVNFEAFSGVLKNGVEV